jgi:hypothetical protein
MDAKGFNKMKKISLEHSIRIIKEEGALTQGQKPWAASDFIGSNAGPLGFGVYPKGTPSIENTKNLSPAKPDMMPTAQQEKQQKERQAVPAASSSSTPTPPAEVSTSTSVSKTAPRLKSGSFQKENYSSLEHTIRNIHLKEFEAPKTKPTVKPTERPAVEPSVVPETLPAVTPGQVPGFPAPKRVKTVPIEVPNKPAPVEAPDVAPVEPTPAPKTPKEPKTAPEPAVEPATDLAPNTRVSPKAEPKTAPDTAPKTNTETPPKTATETTPKTAPKAPESKLLPKALTALPFLFGGSSNEDKGVPKDAPNFTGKTHTHGTRERTAHAADAHVGAVTKQILKRRAMKEESEGQAERKKIEYVPRGKLDPKSSLGRLASVKKLNETDLPVVDTQNSKPSHAAKIKSIVLDKKATGTGENPIVEKEPKLKPLHMAEGIRARYAVPAAAAGVAAVAPNEFNAGLSGAIQGAGKAGRAVGDQLTPELKSGISKGASWANDKYTKIGNWAAEKLDKINPMLEPGKRATNEKGESEYTTKDPEYHAGAKDTAAMVGSMIPGPVGAASGIYGAKRALQRGDYSDAFVNAVSAIPGVGTVTGALKGVKAGANVVDKAAKTTQTVGSVANKAATGIVAHDLTAQAAELSDPDRGKKAETPATPASSSSTPSATTPSSNGLDITTKKVKTVPVTGGYSD